MAKPYNSGTTTGRATSPNSNTDEVERPLYRDGGQVPGATTPPAPDLPGEYRLSLPHSPFREGGAPPREKDEVWTTKDGRRIPICDLTEDHAKQILRMILRRIRRRQAIRAQFRALAAELKADGAADWPWGDD